MRFTLALSVVVLCAALLSGPAPVATAGEPTTPAVVAAESGPPAVVLSAEEVSTLESRQDEASPLNDFHGGGVTDVVAWTALGIGTAALACAIVLFCI